MKRYLTLLVEFDEDLAYPPIREVDVELFTGGKVLVFSNVNLFKDLINIGGCKNGNCED